MISNPVLKKELLLRLRWRQPTPARIGVLLAVLAVTGLIYWSVFSAVLSSTGVNNGHDAWQLVMGAQFVLILLVTPAITANAITREKEQQTWEMLIFTRLLPGEIILGKLLARMATVLLIMALFLPISLFAWAHTDHQGLEAGSYVTMGQFVLVYVATLISATFFAAFGLFMSWLLQRTLYALMLSYTFIIGFLCIGTTLISAVGVYLTQDSSIMDHFPLMWVNPIMILFYALNLGSSNLQYYLIYGILIYAVATLLMLWRMITGFRRYAYE
ncbi:MAG TPA: hypothetical protein VFA07_17985 [Chthonomonadaceae bacterium]|nr:hypothetical protein [Chthonomonadaceae bacterium]